MLGHGGHSISQVTAGPGRGMSRAPVPGWPGMIGVTGANGHLGQRLLPLLAARGPVRALVRSARAAGQVQALGLRGVEVQRVDYADAESLAGALAGCAAVVHLVGIIREGAGNRYLDAHERACAALADAAARAGLGRIVYLSILGATADSRNACLASKGAAEAILLGGSVATVVIRVPMVLGEGDYASAALARRARRGFNVLLRGNSLEQPIDAADVVQAVCAALPGPDGTASGVGAAAYDLAGPESLTRRALVHRSAASVGRRTRVWSVPLGLGMAAAWLLEHLLANPPVTRAMLGVLDHDDRIDPLPAARALGVELTPLDETLARCL